MYEASEPTQRKQGKFTAYTCATIESLERAPKSISTWQEAKDRLCKDREDWTTIRWYSCSWGSAVNVVKVDVSTTYFFWIASV